MGWTFSNRQDSHHRFRCGCLASRLLCIYILLCEAAKVSCSDIAINLTIANGDDRAGRREREIEDAKFEKGTAELMAYRAQMSQGYYSRGPQRL